MPSVALLQQLTIALEHALLLVPPDTREKIESERAKAEALGEEVSSEQIRAELITIGKMEWPYRRAYAQLAKAKAGAMFLDFFLEALEPTLRAKVEGLGVREVPFLQWCDSRVVADECTPEEMVQMEQAWSEAEKRKREEVFKRIAEGGEWQAEYQEALKEQVEEQKKIEEALARLAALVEVDEHWGPEIQAQLDHFQEGWSVLERDVELSEVEHAVEYWQGMLTVGGEGGGR